MEFDINTPVENPKLTNILQNLRETDKNNSNLINEYMNEIAKEFALNAKCLAIIEIDEDSLEENAENQVIAKEDSKISFIHYETEDNQIFFPVFTDWNELRKGEDFKNNFVNTAVLTFDDYYSLVKNYNAGVVINPFSDNLIFSYENICYMKQMKDIEQTGHHEQVIEEDTEVLLGEPKPYPQDLINAICSYAKNVKEINAIWLKLMVKGGEQSFLLIVDSIGDKQSIYGGIAKIGQQYLPTGMYIDMIPYDTPFGKNAATNKPFYKKKSSIFPFKIK